MGFEVVSLKLAGTINPVNQMELEHYLRWNAVLDNGSFHSYSSSFKRIHRTPELY
jgi:hypothetical protein